MESASEVKFDRWLGDNPPAWTYSVNRVSCAGPITRDRFVLEAQTETDLSDIIGRMQMANELIQKVGEQSQGFLQTEYKILQTGELLVCVTALGGRAEAKAKIPLFHWGLR